MARKFFSFIFRSFILVFTIASFISAYLVFYYTRELPDYSQLAKYHPPLTTRLYSMDGKLIEQYAKENRVFVPIETVPGYLINAFIAAEDKNFYHHHGIDFIGLIRAVISNVNNIIHNKRLEGASTITQQVVKNFLLTNERSIARKVKEAVLSYMVSKSLTKNQILELYLNQTFFGKGAYGVASAAQTYFDKSVEDLNLEEAAFIAGLPKAPSKFDPARNYERSKERRDYVITRMLEDGYITVENAKKGLDAPIKLVKRNLENMINAGYFAENVRNIAIDMYGEEEFYTGGLTIITTMDSELQKDAEAAFIEGVRLFDERRGFRKPIANISTKNWAIDLNKIPDQMGQRNYSLAVVIKVADDSATIGLKDGNIGIIPLPEVKWARSMVKSVKSILQVGNVVAVERAGGNYALRNIPEINGGLVIEDSHTGAIKAHIGGYDYNSNKFDRVVQAQRQPGSLAKTFVYLTALENNIPPNTIYDDAPIEISQGKGLPNWKPKNYKGDFLGPITFRTALEKSRNLVTVRVAKHVGLNKVGEMITRLGINNCKPPYYYSMILGAIETNLSKMANAYAILSNGGEQVMPHYIELIQDRKGKIIYRRDEGLCKNCENFGNLNDIPEIERPAKHRLVDKASIYQLTSILSAAVQRGTSARLSKFKIPLAAKTGTTNNSFDTWHIAYTPDLVFGTYLGYDNPRTMGKTATGATVALPVIDALLTRVIKKIEIKDFAIPDDIELVKIDKNTGAPSEGRDAIMEAFKKNAILSDNKYHEDTGEVKEDDIFDDATSTEEKIEFFEDTGEVY